MARAKWEDWKKCEWDKLGEGAYNLVYQSRDKKHVFKIQQRGLAAIDIPPDLPERSVRLWNEVNPDLLAVLAETDLGKGWICPFVNGVQPTDKEISGAVIDIFNRTGRVLADAPGRKNFIKTHTGRVVCIDIGLALQMEQREEVLFAGQHKRRKSIVSLDAWRVIGTNFNDFFNAASHANPTTVLTVKALLFIKFNRPDVFDVSFLTRSPDLITQLAKAYNVQELEKRLVDQRYDKQAIVKELSYRGYSGQETDSSLAALDKETTPSVDLTTKPPITTPVPIVITAVNDDSVAKKSPVAPANVDKGLQILKNERPINFDNIKESCIHELKRYISLRGSIDKNEQFNPSIATKLFRNQQLTASKVGIARRLMDTIKKADSLEIMLTAIKASKEEPKALESSFTSGLGTSLGKCLLIVEVAKANPEPKPAPTDAPSV